MEAALIQLLLATDTMLPSLHSNLLLFRLPLLLLRRAQHSPAELSSRSLTSSLSG
jgi:hypothetical protein